MKTLVVAPNWIGDALMAQPLLTLLKRADPAQRIVCLAPRWVAPVLAAMPEVDRVIATDLAHGTLQWQARRRFAHAVAAEQFDRAFVLPNSFKSALIPWLARIPVRIGYRGEARYGLLNRRAAGPDRSLAMSERYAALAGVLGIDVVTPLPLPHLAVQTAAIAAARARFGLDGQLIALCPGAEFGPAKRWPAEHFASLATMLLAERPDAHVLLLGGNGDRAIADAIVAAASNAGARLHNLCGDTDLAEAIALIAASSSVVSNDSGLMHVAAALSRPQVALFGSSDPRHTPPLSPHAKTLWLHLDCSPCFERRCPLGHLDCLVGIAPQRVLDSMQNTTPSPPLAGP
jgi:heptosyltransferase-2